MNGKHYIGKRASSLELYDEIGPITGVALIVDDKNKCFAGDESGYVLTAECPYATDQMAADALAKVQNKTYLGYRSTDTVLPVDAELGDGVTVGGIYSLLAYRKVSFGPGHMSEISAPGENEVDHEYPYVSSTKREIDRKLAQTRSEITKTAEEITQRVESVEGAMSEFNVSLKGLSGRVEDAEGKAAEASLRLDGFTVTTYDEDGNVGTVKLKDGAVTADAVAASAITSDKIAANVSIESPSLILRTPLTDMTSPGQPALHVIPTGQATPFGSIYYSYKNSPGSYESAHNLWITTREYKGIMSSEPYGSIKIRSGFRMSIEAQVAIYMNGGTQGIVFGGQVDFSNATVSGLSGVTAVFG